jgi:hypothetical protein
MASGGSAIVRWSELDRLALFQVGQVTRRQCLTAGMTDEMIAHRLSTRRWSRTGSGVYLTTPGRQGWDVDAAAALLAVTGFGPTDLALPAAGPPLPPVALWGTAAARAWDMPGVGRAPVQLAVPAPRSITPPRGIALRRISHWERRVDPVLFPWRTTKAATILDCAAGGTADGALAWVALAIQKRIVPVVLLERELASRPRLRHGALLREVIVDIRAGAHSAAEVRYVRDVERPHGLPTASRQVKSAANGGAIHDNTYEPYDVVIEVDGRLGHEQWADRVRDGRRDRQLGARGQWTSRVFWSDVAVTPCATAGEVAALLTVKGWIGAAHPCRRPGCAAQLGGASA